MNDFLNNAEMAWDAVIEEDSQEYKLLDKGIYRFEVDGMERARTSGEGKLPPCNMAKLTLSVQDGDYWVTVYTNLILHSSLEWKLSQFFASIGLKKRGEPLRMDWGAIAGESGMLEIGHREFNGKIYNDVVRFLTPEEAIDAKEKETTSKWTAGTF
jgi:hypothetical protein